MRQKIAQDIRNFIVENFLFNASSNGLQETDSFLDRGIIDSTGVLELVLHLEETYGFRVEDEELVPENLDSISCVSVYVTEKLKKLSNISFVDNIPTPSLSHK